MKNLYLLLVIAIALLMSACTTYLPVQVHSGTTLRAELPYDKFTILGSGSGTTCQSNILGFPLSGGGEAGTYKSAVNIAIGEKNGDHLINATSDISLTGFPHPFYLPIYVEQCVTVEGLVIKFK